MQTPNVQAGAPARELGKPPNTASIQAAFKCWHVNSGEYEPDPDPASHWGVFWEPLYVRLPASARPSCCYSDKIAFYDRSGNKLLQDFVTHYQFIGVHPHLLWLEGKWREVVGGRVEFRNGFWHMRWTVATNTRYARMLNGEKETSRA